MLTCTALVLAEHRSRVQRGLADKDGNERGEEVVVVAMFLTTRSARRTSPLASKAQGQTRWRLERTLFKANPN